MEWIATAIKSGVMKAWNQFLQDLRRNPPPTLKTSSPRSEVAPTQQFERKKTMEQMAEAKTEPSESSKSVVITEVGRVWIARDASDKVVYRRSRKRDLLRALKQKGYTISEQPKETND